MWRKEEAELEQETKRIAVSMVMVYAGGWRWRISMPFFQRLASAAAN
ncbi:MAG: hypothetical protein AAB466_00375 [Verrucomicrobiota bacterium]